MQFRILVKTYDSFGVHKTFRELGHRISRQFGETQFGLAEVEVVVWSEMTGPTKLGLEPLRAKFRQEIAHFPVVRFERRRERLRLSYVGMPDLTRDGYDREAPTDEMLEVALGGLLLVFDSLRSKLEGKPGLQFTAFADTLRELRVSVIGPSGEAFRQPHPCIDEAAPWWVRFGIDWSRYHAQARELLDDPFYWDPANDDSPHGANSGASLLGDYCRWRKAHAADSPWEFLLGRFRRSGDLGRFNEFRETNPAAYVTRDGLIAQMHDRDVIALAFALLKVDGACDPEVGREALDALRRRQDQVVSMRLGWLISPGTLAIAAKLEAKLQHLV